jgi:hypothetical protein
LAWQKFGYARCPRYAIVHHEFTVSQPKNNQRRHARRGVAKSLHLALKLRRISSCIARGRQPQGARINIDVLARAHQLNYS